MRYGRPPLNPTAIREARLAKGMTQPDVEQQCAMYGTPVHNLSRMEAGEVRWPAPKRLSVLAEVLGLEIRDLLMAEDVAA